MLIVLNKLSKLVSYLLIYYEKYIRIVITRAYSHYLSRKIINKGLDLRIHGRIDILDINELTVGDYCRIGRGCFLFCKGGIEIGNNVQLSRNIIIYSGNHNYKSDILPYDNSYLFGKVKIGNSVWIGMNVMILPGVQIGDGAIIGMGSIITKNIPEGSIVVGNNRVVGKRSASVSKDYNNPNKFFGNLFPDA